MQAVLPLLMLIYTVVTQPIVEPVKEEIVVEVVQDEVSTPSAKIKVVEEVKPKTIEIEGIKKVKGGENATFSGKVVEGKVSHYSVAGCLGCSKTLTMANGEKLSDEVPTIACNRLKLNSRVRVTNLDNGLSVEARVTDTGGFEKYGRVADLTPAVYRAIGTKTDISNVRIEVIK